MSHLQYTIELHSIFICLLVAVFYIIVCKRIRTKESDLIAGIVIVNAFDLFWDIMAYSQQGVATTYGFRMHAIADFFLFFLEYVMYILLIYYIYLILKRYTGKECRLLFRISVCSELVLAFHLLINLFTGCYFYFDEQNYYHRGPIFVVSVVLHFIIMSSWTYKVVRNRRQIPRYHFITLILYFVLPLLGMILQSVFFGFSFLNICVSVSLLLFFFHACYEIVVDWRKREEMLAYTQTCLMGAQMNPHFIFNCLSVIGYLMEDDVEKAQNALYHFSRYLRKNIDLDPQKGLVSLENELDFAEEYIYMEKVRFGDAINVEYEIETEDFRLPFLTIEPLVENAIKHGIRKRIGKGTVLIKIWKEDHFNYIMIRDDAELKGKLPFIPSFFMKLSLSQK